MYVDSDNYRLTNVISLLFVLTGVIFLGSILEQLKDDLESIISQPELICDESFMMGLLKP